MVHLVTKNDFVTKNQVQPTSVVRSFFLNEIFVIVHKDF
jgi:hypothetical protein